MSSNLHNAAFKVHGLPCHYSIYESEGVDERIQELVIEPTFDGPSVTTHTNRKQGGFSKALRYTCGGDWGN